MNPGILYSGRVRAGMRKIQNSGFQTLVPLKWEMFGPFQGLSLLLVEVLIREVHCTSRCKMIACFLSQGVLLIVTVILQFLFPVQPSSC